MLVTDRFVYIHLERTAGNFFADFVRLFVPRCKAIGYHYTRALLPAQYRSLPIIGFVRNPWDWYVSFYIHKISFVPGVARYSFEELTRLLLHLNDDTRAAAEFKQKFLALCPASIEGNQSMGVTVDELCAFRATDIGFYSWLVHRMFADEHGRLDDVLFGSYEALEDDIARLLSACGVPFTAEMNRFVRDGAARRSVPHHSYYGDALRDDVSVQDRRVIERFGYRFDG